MPEDHQLLRDYADDRSESAFTELVRRHIDLVYSAALRETHGDGPMAEDISQSVFAELAAQASRLRDHPALAGWLYTCVRRMAANARRSNARRQRREQDAHTMNESLSTDSTESSWRQVEPVLDDVMHELSETDRSAVVLRFFEDRSHKEVGLALGLSETAARKRVDRALESLRALLAKRGVTVGASGLVVVISANAVQAAPVGLAITISTASAALAGTAIAATATVTATKAIAMTTLQKALISATLVAGLATPLVIQHQAQVKLRDENRQQLNALGQLQADNEYLSNQLAQANGTPRLPNEQFNELLRLRGEVGSLRRQTNELAGLQAENQRLKTSLTAASAQPKVAAQTTPSEESLPRESWAFLGYADPESAFQSTLWAMRQGDARTYLASLSPEGRESKNLQGKSETEMLERATREMEKLTAFKILETETVSDSEVVLTIYASGVDKTGRFKLQRVGNEWKFDGPMKDGGGKATK